MKQKKEISELLKNPYQPPPVIAQVDCFTEELKTNKDIAKNEIKFTFTPSEPMSKLRKNLYAKYYFNLTDNAKL